MGDSFSPYNTQNESKLHFIVDLLQIQESLKHFPWKGSNFIVDSHLYYLRLGVTISKNPTWNKHINEIIKKASKHLYFVSQLKKARVAKQDLVLFYTSCIRSILTYASPVFFYALPEYLKNELEHIQKRARRIICPGHCYNDAMELANIVPLYLRDL